MKKPKKIINKIVIISIILIFVGALIYAKIPENTNQFHYNRADKGRILYKDVMDMNAEYKYPKTPEEVMGKKANTLMLMYGDFVVDESLYTDIITQQRLLFSDELLQLNPFDEQIENFINFLEILRDEDEEIRVVNIEVLPIIYPPNTQNIAVARVSQSYRNLGQINWVYYLERSTVDDKWRITGWYLTDENFIRVL